MRFTANIRCIAKFLCLCLVASPLAAIPLEAGLAQTPKSSREPASSGPHKAEQAVKDLLARAKRGEPDAEYRLASLGLMGKLGKQEPKNVIGLLVSASGKGHREATFMLGMSRSSVP